MSLFGRAIGVRALAVCLGLILGLVVLNAGSQHARYSPKQVERLVDWRMQQLKERQAELVHLEQDFSSTVERTREFEELRRAIADERALRASSPFVTYLLWLAMAITAFSISYGLFDRVRERKLFHFASSVRRVAYGLLPLLTLASLSGVVFGLAFFFAWPLSSSSLGEASTPPAILSLIDPYGIGTTYAHLAFGLGVVFALLLCLCAPLIKRRKLAHDADDARANVVDIAGILCGSMLITCALHDRVSVSLWPLLAIVVSFVVVGVLVMALLRRRHELPFVYRFGLSVVSAAGAGELGRARLMHELGNDYLGSSRSLMSILVFQRGATIAVTLYLLLSFFVSQDIAFTLAHVIVASGLVILAALLIGRSAFVAMAVVLFLAPSFGYQASAGAYLSDQLLVALPLAIACDTFVSFMLFETLNQAPKELVITGEETGEELEVSH